MLLVRRKEMAERSGRKGREVVKSSKPAELLFCQLVPGSVRQVRSQ